MKLPDSRKSRSLLNFAVCISIAAVPVQMASAADQYWNAGGTGGDGNWGTSPGDKNWNTVAGAPAGNTPWLNSAADTAVFQDATGGTVTVFGDVQAAHVLLNGADYAINAGNITLVQDPLADAPSITVQTGRLTVDSVLAGNDGMNKLGTGELVLAGTNTYTGTTALTAGTLTLTGSLASATVKISGGATLADVSGGLIATTTVNNSGSLITAVSETVASYTQNSGGILSGTGALTATAGAILHGGTIAGTLLGDTESNGDVLISGRIAAGSLTIRSGTVSSTGISDNSVITLDAGASLIDANGGLSSTSILTSSGTLTLGADDTVSTYTQNAGAVLAGPGALTVAVGATLNGGTVAGRLLGDLTSTGAVLVSGSLGGGSLGGGSLAVSGGTLTLAGTSENLPVSISSGASLIDSNGGLASAASVVNSGTLAVNSSETISLYRSNGGTLAGTGTLHTPTAELNSNSSVTGLLDAGLLTSRGVVSVSGTAVADSILIESGFLTNTGTLGDASTLLTLASGAALVASGSQHYAMLATSGTGVATWQGNLTNPTTVSPGGDNAFGSLLVTGDFTNSPEAALRMDVGLAGHDALIVQGEAVLGGALALNQSGVEEIAPFTPLQLITATGYSGNFSSLTENLDGSVFFNPANGTILRLTPSDGENSFLSAVSRNQRSTWLALYDDVIDPGASNVQGTTITGGIADETNPDLLWALDASFTPNGLDAALLNHLSAETYTSLSDYATQATRLHQRTAISAPALVTRATGDSKSALPSSAKSGAKDVIQPAPSVIRDWEFFAAVDYFNVETDNSHNRADYDLNGAGIVTGARTRLNEHFQLAAYGALDDGSIDGNRIDSDQFGWSIGLIGEALLHEKSRTLLTTAISYGHYDSDGTRESAAPGPAGWTSGKVDFSDIGSHSLELYLGAETTVYQNARFRLIPSAGLRYASSGVDGFTESTSSAAGSPIALKVNADNRDEWIAEMAINAEAVLTDQFTLHGQLGFNSGIGNDPHEIDYRFEKGSRSMRAEADGLTDQLIYLGLGVEYRLNRDVSIGLGYRTDIRSDHPVGQQLSISSAFRF